MNLATLTENDAETTSNKAGLLIGGYLVHPIATNVEFQPELLFSQKGTRVLDTSDNAKVSLGYFELPVLLRYNVPVTSPDVHPYFYAGPALAYRASCNISVTTGAITTSGRCASPADNAADLTPKRYDLGGVIGGGLVQDEWPRPHDGSSLRVRLFHRRR